MAIEIVDFPIKHGDFPMNSCFFFGNKTVWPFVSECFRMLPTKNWKFKLASFLEVEKKPRQDLFFQLRPTPQQVIHLMLMAPAGIDGTEEVRVDTPRDSFKMWPTRGFQPASSLLLKHNYSGIGLFFLSHCICVYIYIYRNRSTLGFTMNLLYYWDMTILFCYWGSYYCTIGILLCNITILLSL